MSSIIKPIFIAIRAGLAIFPLKERGKVPVYSGSGRNATRSRQRVIKHWRNYPNHNYGIVTGETSGIFVLDIDGPAGEASLTNLCNKQSPLPSTVTVKTGKGRHLYFKTNGAPVGNSVGKLGPGLDIRGHGGYVVGAGSIHPSGHMYQYVDGHDPDSIPIADPPLWLLRLVRKQEASKASNAPALSPISKIDRHYGLAALDAELQRVGNAPMHQRNDTLNVSSFRVGQLIAAGYLDAGNVVERLTSIATEIGLEATEIAKTIRSGIDAGRRFPRHKTAPPNKSTAQRADGCAVDPTTAALALLGCTDADNAERFVKRFGHKFAYCPSVGWLCFNGKRWLSDAGRSRILAAMQTARRIAEEVAYISDKNDQQQRASHAKHSLSKAGLDRMLDLAAPMMMVDVTKLDANPWLLNVLNGTIDLRSGRLQPHDPRDMLTKVAPVQYDPKLKHRDSRNLCAASWVAMSNYIATYSC